MRRVLLRGTHLWIVHAALGQFATCFEITRVTVKLAVRRRADRVLMLEDHAFERTTAGPGRAGGSEEKPRQRRHRRARDAYPACDVRSSAEPWVRR